VELQNTFRLDRFFLRGTLLVDPSGAPATAFQVDRAEDLYARFTDSYLPALRSRLWDLGTAAAGTVESAAVPRPERPLSSGLSVHGMMRSADLRQRLDDIEDRLAADKQTATGMVTAVLGRTKASSPTTVAMTTC
jgi:hypothetical protein